MSQPQKYKQSNPSSHNNNFSINDDETHWCAISVTATNHKWNNHKYMIVESIETHILLCKKFSKWWWPQNIPMAATKQHRIELSMSPF